MDTKKTPHPRVQKILDRVRAKMATRGESYGPAAEAAAAASGRNVSYQQWHDWLNGTKGNPKPESLDVMEAYCELPDKRETVEFT